ncbi:MAG: hypothetical protein ACP5I8_01630 [Phycisphaerae bacterium]
MQESLFVGVFESIAKEILGDSAVYRKANLFYELFLDQKLDLAAHCRDTRHPKRGFSAFQTDICICEMRQGIPFPRVVIEFKKDITTHDILTYSTKAGRHKQIYPCLRYGVLSSDTDSIPSRFFVHNEHLDFFVAAKRYQNQETLRPFTKSLLEKELEISRILEQIHFGDRKCDYYRRDIVFQNLGSVHRQKKAKQMKIK